ncbi:hypothetical protein CVT25_005636 [Psilocybe cyanescens]|uniref:Lysine-specific metallo-endopeptidase domain-containing protein n=1 Tax=Psilocybe cyanescens TaxID=93625 RepID=A0A409X6H5_PSICY|nr:hypothetical protein CVT25_005636 [Psilocybe cyanescens]
MIAVWILFIFLAQGTRAVPVLTFKYNDPHADKYPSERQKLEAATEHANVLLNNMVHAAKNPHIQQNQDALVNAFGKDHNLPELQANLKKLQSHQKPLQVDHVITDSLNGYAKSHRDGHLSFSDKFYGPGMNKHKQAQIVLHEATHTVLDTVDSYHKKPHEDTWSEGTASTKNIGAHTMSAHPVVGWDHLKNIVAHKMHRCAYAYEQFATFATYGVKGHAPPSTSFCSKLQDSSHHSTTSSSSGGRSGSSHYPQLSSSAQRHGKTVPQVKHPQSGYLHQGGQAQLDHPRPGSSRRTDFAHNSVTREHHHQQPFKVGSVAVPSHPVDAVNKDNKNHEVHSQYTTSGFMAFGKRPVLKPAVASGSHSQGVHPSTSRVDHFQSLNQPGYSVDHREKLPPISSSSSEKNKGPGHLAAPSKHRKLQKPRHSPGHSEDRPSPPRNHSNRVASGSQERGRPRSPVHGKAKDHRRRRGSSSSTSTPWTVEINTTKQLQAPLKCLFVIEVSRHTAIDPQAGVQRVHRESLASHA